MMTRLSGEKEVRSAGGAGGEWEGCSLSLRSETATEAGALHTCLLARVCVCREVDWGKRQGSIPRVSSAFRQYCVRSKGRPSARSVVAPPLGAVSVARWKKTRGESELELGAKLSEVAPCWSNCLIVLKPFCRSVTLKEGSLLRVCVCVSPC